MGLRPRPRTRIGIKIFNMLRMAKGAIIVFPLKDDNTRFCCAIEVRLSLKHYDAMPSTQVLFEGGRLITTDPRMYAAISYCGVDLSNLFHGKPDIFKRTNVRTAHLSQGYGAIIPVDLKRAETHSEYLICF